MYLSHFQFTSKPFALNPDPKFLYPSVQHAKALTMLEYAIESQAAFCVLTGEIGSGKTTLLRHLIRGLGDQIIIGLISNSHERFESIHPWALSALGIVPRESSDVGRYEALTEFFIREYGKGRRTLLIFDEAQNLPIHALEELRLLSNINSEGDVAVQTLLVGQPELRKKLARPEMTQFAQRVVIDFHLQSLTLSEAEAYIRHRLTIAGGSESIFRPTAIKYIHHYSGGVPRLMNQLCDMSLVYAFAEGCERIDVSLVAKMLHDRSARGSSEAVPRHPNAAPGTSADGTTPPVSGGDGLLRERA